MYPHQDFVRFVALPAPRDAPMLACARSQGSRAIHPDVTGFFPSRRSPWTRSQQNSPSDFGAASIPRNHFPRRSRRTDAERWSLQPGQVRRVMVEGCALVGEHQRDTVTVRPSDRKGGSATRTIVGPRKLRDWPNHASLAFPFCAVWADGRESIERLRPGCGHPPSRSCK